MSALPGTAWALEMYWKESFHLDSHVAKMGYDQIDAQEI
jgi:hypothetical protein